MGSCRWGGARLAGAGPCRRPCGVALRHDVLTPVGHGIAAAVRGTGVGLAWLARMLTVVPARWLYAMSLRPSGTHHLGRPGLGLAIATTARGTGAPGPGSGDPGPHSRPLGVRPRPRPFGKGPPVSARTVGVGIALAARGVGLALKWLAKVVFVWPWVGLWRYGFVPVGRGLGWLGGCSSSSLPGGFTRACDAHRARDRPGWRGELGPGSPGPGAGSARDRMARRGIGTAARWIFVVPAVALWRWVSPRSGVASPSSHARSGTPSGTPGGRGTPVTAVWRFLADSCGGSSSTPVRWRTVVLTPVGHLVRDGIWRPAARAVKDAGRTGTPGPRRRPRKRPAGAGRRAAHALGAPTRAGRPSPRSHKPAGTTARRDTYSRCSTTALTKD